MGHWKRVDENDEVDCEGCGETLEQGEDVFIQGAQSFCEGCYEEGEFETEEDDDVDYGDSHDFENLDDDRSMFADPGGRSALRAASRDNPRNLPCPSCGGKNLLTPADVARGYQCDGCADMVEGGGY